jgi:hypothetical protein
MKIIKTCLAVAGLAALAACNGGAEENNLAADANMMVTDNFGMEENLTTDMNDLNAVDMNDVNAVDNTADNTANTY